MPPELLTRMVDARRTEAVDRHSLGIALEYSDELPDWAAKNGAEDDVGTNTDGTTVRVKNQSYWIPWPKRAAARLDDIAGPGRDQPAPAGRGPRRQYQNRLRSIPADTRMTRRSATGPI